MVELYTLSYYLMYTQFTHLLYVVFRNYVGLDGATITTHYKFYFTKSLIIYHHPKIIHILRESFFLFVARL